MAKIKVQGSDITVLALAERDYISLTDMAGAKDGDSRAADIIKNWMRNRYTIEFLGTWEMIHNPGFKVVEFDHFRKQAGLPSFVLSASEWIESTNAIGIVVRKGRYGGTYAYKDIAFEFGTAISVPFKLYLIEEFQRLKEQEQARLGWSAKRELSKINYRIHTDAIKHNLVPSEVTPQQANRIYASEADVLNVALFGMTAAEWREAEPQCCIYQRGPAPARKAYQTQSDCYPSDADIGRHSHRSFWQNAYKMSPVRPCFRQLFTEVVTPSGKVCLPLRHGEKRGDHTVSAGQRGKAGSAP